MEVHPPSTVDFHVGAPGWFSSNPFSLAAWNVSSRTVTPRLASFSAVLSTGGKTSFEDVTKVMAFFLLGRAWSASGTLESDCRKS